MLDVLKYTIALELGMVPDFKNPQELNAWMNKNITYAEFRRLKTADEVAKSKSGSCHDQVVFELAHLKKMVNCACRTHFFMELNESTGQGGMTHSFVTYTIGHGLDVFWFENAASMWAGIRKFKSWNAIRSFILDAHNKGRWGNKNSYPSVIFGSFKGAPGDDLQTIVSKSL